MRIEKPSVSYWAQQRGINGIWKQIARATRVCYNSKPRVIDTVIDKTTGEETPIYESDKDFVKRIILDPARDYQKDVDSFNFNKMHGAMLEHGTAYLHIKNWSIIENDETRSDGSDLVFLCQNPYTKYNCFGETDELFVVTNMRVLFENNDVYLLKYLDDSCLEGFYDIQRHTFHIITSIDISRELNRHRVNSMAERSTRYINFTKANHGNGVTYCQSRFDDDSDIVTYNNLSKEAQLDKLKQFCNDIISGNKLSAVQLHNFALLACDYAYCGMKDAGVINDIARKVLPLQTMTEAVYTAFEDDWMHFIKLRFDNASGKTHPDANFVAKQIKFLYDFVINDNSQQG